MEIAGYPLRRLRARAVEGIDGPLFGLALALSVVGLAVLYSASYGNASRVASQLANLAVALAAMWAVAQVPPQTLSRFAVPAYATGLALLVAVAVGGEVVNGARRWLNLGVMRFQPSEMMKIATPMMLAWYFHRREGAIRLRDFALAGILLAVPVAFIVRQPDLGTALLVAAAGFYVIYFAGIGWKLLAGLGVVVLASLPPLWGLLHDYQRRRILTLLDPSQDPLGAGYHTIQSTIAVGSGGAGRQGLAEWLADAPRVHPRAPHRLHLRRVLGGVRPRGQRAAARALCAAHRARAGHRRAGGDAVRAAARGRGDARVLHLRVRQHGDGVGDPARGGRAAAVHFLRRHRARDALHRHRHPHEHSPAPQARSDLSFLQGSTILKFHPAWWNNGVISRCKYLFKCLFVWRMRRVAAPQWVGYRRRDSQPSFGDASPCRSETRRSPH
jgi:hypothetical protein